MEPATESLVPLGSPASCVCGQPANKNLDQGAIISTGTVHTLSSPPASLLKNASIFLDLDGTLLELIDRPDEVIADAELHLLLTGLHQRHDGRIAIVSGRSLAQLDAILGPVAQTIALSGSHGTEHRWQGIAAQPVRPAALDAAERRFEDFADRHPGVLVERKSYGTALHYRMRPEAGEAAMALAAALAAEFGLHLQEGKMMAELRVPGGNKGVALRRLMQRAPMAGTRPVFIGDDWTDEPAFVAAAELGGAGVLVGEPRDTAASYGLADPAAVRAWLAEGAA